MGDINKRDTLKPLYQILEVNIVKMPTPKNRHMPTLGEIATEECLAGLEMTLPCGSATQSAMADRYLFSKKSTSPCAQRGRCEAPFQYF
ncbi:MAG: hypothetical protein CAK90_04935 [Spartobacteria bacterium AMD-G4]|nr:MAG: hypothetical protein CAK90_04935 [Spartobacteria bacterium AMD-G4]